jgi:hypothetical protein
MSQWISYAFYMNKIIAIFFTFFYCCSSINQVNNDHKIINPPKLPFLDSIDSTIDLTDCRIGKQNNSIITFYFLNPEFSDEIDINWKNLFIEYQEKIYSSKESKIIFESIPRDDPTYTDFCKKNSLDIIIKTSLELMSNSIKVNQTLIDSHTNYIYDYITYEIEKSLNGTNKNLVEFYYESNKLNILPNFSNKTLAFKKIPNINLIKKIVQNNLFSRINLYSSDPGLVILFNNEVIGSPPILNYKVKSGSLKITFKKVHSNLMRDKFYNFRGGSSYNLIDLENGNFVNTTLYLWSHPLNLPVYRDGIVIGSTPLFMNSILPGLKSISINENKDSKINIKQGEDNVLIKLQELEDGVSEPFIWDLKNSSSLHLDTTCGICITNPDKNYIDEWTGIFTHPLEKGNIKISGKLFSIVERGEGEFLIGMFNDSIRQSIYFNDDRIWIFDFLNSNKSINSYKFDSSDDSELTLTIKINYINNLINFYINNKKIHSSKFNREGEWRLYIAAKGSIYNKINILKNINFLYD